MADRCEFSRPAQVIGDHSNHRTRSLQPYYIVIKRSVISTCKESTSGTGCKTEFFVTPLSAFLTPKAQFVPDMVTEELRHHAHTVRICPKIPKGFRPPAQGCRASRLPWVNRSITRQLQRSCAIPSSIAPKSLSAVYTSHCGTHATPLG